METTNCVLWWGSFDRDGYGRTRAHGKTTSAHRALYEATRGPIPPGMDLDHRCRVRSCVNPEHMDVVTRAVNLDRRYGGVRKDYRAAVLRALAEGPMSASGLLGSVRGKTTLVFATLRDMCRDGTVTTTGKGVRGKPRIYSAA